MPVSVPPLWVAPMLVTSGRDAQLDPDDYAYELKLDGYRAQARIHRGAVTLLSRRRRDMTASFPELTTPPESLVARSVVLDGELVCFDQNGRPSFEDLARRRGRSGRSADLYASGETTATFVCFDVLYLDGDLTLAEPYHERRRRLVDLGISGERWRTCPQTVGHAGAERLWEETRRLGLEGAVAKRLDSPYRAGRRSAVWLKFKHPHARDLMSEYRPERRRDPLRGPSIVFA